MDDVHRKQHGRVAGCHCPLTLKIGRSHTCAPRPGGALWRIGEEQCPPLVCVRSERSTPPGSSPSTRRPEVAEGEFVALLGPTGCGKSTILRLIAGLESPTPARSGFRRPVDRHRPRERRVAMVFQDYALYPHLTAAQNIAFPLNRPHRRRHPLPRCGGRRLVGVEDLLHRRPDKLSGGQRQRVAMARAIARDPAAFLLDEPLSNVDARSARSSAPNLTGSQRCGWPRST